MALVQLQPTTRHCGTAAAVPPAVKDHPRVSYTCYMVEHLGCTTLPLLPCIHQRHAYGTSRGRGGIVDSVGASLQVGPPGMLGLESGSGLMARACLPAGVCRQDLGLPDRPVTPAEHIWPESI